jgi:hypothetical protein
VVESTSDRHTGGQAVISTSYDIGVAHDGGYAQFAHAPAEWGPNAGGLSRYDSVASGTAGFTAAPAISLKEDDGPAPGHGLSGRKGRHRRRGQSGIHMLSRLGHTGLVDEVGFDPVDAGGLAESWRQQPGTPAYRCDFNPDEPAGCRLPPSQVQRLGSATDFDPDPTFGPNASHADTAALNRPTSAPDRELPYSLRRQ